MLLTVLIGFVTLSGCMKAPKVVIHPMSPEHIFFMYEGDVVITGNGKKTTVEHDGCFLSEKYQKIVMEVKVERN